MMKNTDIHPDVVLASILEAGGRPLKIKNLNMIHAACRQQHERGFRDFSLKTIGGITQAQGGIAWRSIYQTAEYTKLIEAWAAYAGPAEPKPRTLNKPQSAQNFLARIEDPAIRTIMESVIIERDKLKAENNLLRSMPKAIIDKRPLGATVMSSIDSEPVPVLTMGARLNDSERRALTKAIDPEFLTDRAWKEGTHGEIINEKGRTIYEVGYAVAIRRILSEG